MSALPPNPHSPTPQRSQAPLIIAIVAAAALLLGAAAWWLVLPRITGRAGAAAATIKSQNNLKEIAMFIQLYCNDWRQYPESLDGLKVYAKVPSVFRHPGNPAPAPAQGRFSEDGDYVFVYAGYKDARTGKALGESALSGSARPIILHERPQHAVKGVIQIAYADGTVDAIPLSELAVRLAAQNPAPSVK